MRADLADEGRHGLTEYSAKRASQRVAANIPVNYVQPGGTQGRAEIGQLSAGGCVLGGTNLEPGGPEVILHFRLGAGQEVHLRGRVVHAQTELGTGLEFLSVSAEGRELLRRYVEENAADSAPSPDP